MVPLFGQAVGDAASDSRSGDCSRIAQYGEMLAHGAQGLAENVCQLGAGGGDLKLACDAGAARPEQGGQGVGAAVGAGGRRGVGTVGGIDEGVTRRLFTRPPTAGCRAGNKDEPVIDEAVGPVQIAESNGVVAHPD